MKINIPTVPPVARQLIPQNAATTSTTDQVEAFYQRMAAFLNSIKPPINAAALHAAVNAAAKTATPEQAAAAGAAWQDIRHTLTPIYTPHGLNILVQALGAFPGHDATKPPTPPGGTQ